MSLALTCAGGAALDACAGSNGTTNPVDGDAGTDASAVSTLSDGSATPDVAPPQPVHVTFSYKPGWAGVTAVSVVGGFGRSGDWSDALVALTDDGTGTFTGAADVPPGSYLYLLRVTGDSAAAAPAKFQRWVLDPSLSSFDACPGASPTFSKVVPNPCSKLVVPQAPATAMHTVKGHVHVDGAGASGWLVELDRNEPGSHGYFVDRVTTKSDGSFALSAAPGVYRLQVLHPAFLSATDGALDPDALGTLRRSVSSNFPLLADTTLAYAPELAYHGYPAFAPRGAATLPTQFTFGEDGGVPARLAIYGHAKEIGDPWYLAPQASASGASFDGAFNTKAATVPSVAADDAGAYYWGAQEIAVGPDGGLRWSGQTMVFPVSWR